MCSFKVKINLFVRHLFALRENLIFKRYTEKMIRKLYETMFSLHQKIKTFINKQQKHT